MSRSGSEWSRRRTFDCSRRIWIDVTPRGNTTVLMRGSTGITEGMSHSSIRPISDIGRLLIRGDPFHGEGKGRGDEGPRYHSFPPAGQFAPPLRPQNRKATRGSLLMAHRSFSPIPGNRRSSPYLRPGTAPASRCRIADPFLPARLAARRWDDRSRSNQQKNQRHSGFTPPRLLL